MAADASDDAAVLAAVRSALARVDDPELRRPLAELDMIDDVRVLAGRVEVDVSLTIVGCPASERIEADVTRAAAGAAPGREVAVTLGVMAPERRRALVERLKGPARRQPFGAGTLTRVIAVTSGKGGVGKSTVTANLAAALAARGLATGIVDADVHGFSIPGLLGLVGPGGEPVRPTRLDDLIVPPVAHGVKAISIGMFLEDPGAAVAWRGPMLHRTLTQFLTEVHFGDLDVLLLDLPPGTGDVAISLGQLLPDAEVLVVTTPQEAAADVAVRSGLVARQTGQRVVGVIETMAPMTMPDGSVVALFGEGGGRAVAARLSEGGEEVPLVASVPLDMAVRERGDAGTPAVLAADRSPGAAALDRAAAWVAGRGRGLAGRSLGVDPV